MSARDLDAPRRAPLLRPGRAEDAAFLAALANEAFGRYGDYEPVVSEWATASPIETIVAEMEGTPAGAAFLLFLKPGEAPDTKVGDLLAIAVAAPFRGRGIGRALLARVVARARDVARRHGVTTLRLNVAEGNAAARRLFEGAGFRYEEGVGSYPRGQRALHMSLPLRGRARGGSRAD